MPRAQTSNPTRTDVLLLLTISMKFLPRFLSAPATAGAGCRRSQRNLARGGGSWSLEQCHSGWNSKRTGSVSRGFPSGSKTPLYHIETGDHAGGKSGATALVGVRLQFTRNSNAL